jgi:hypothetical protein
LPPRPQDATSAKPSLATNAEENSATEDSGSEGKQEASAPVASKGPQDRYVAPDMQDWTKVYRVGHHLLIPAALNQSVLKLFILDTGAFSTTVSPEAAREVTKVHNEDDMSVRGISGKVKKVYSTGQLTFDFANLRQPASGVVAFDMSNISKHTGLEISGFIGITTLGQLRIRIDYRDALVKFDYDPKRGYGSVF